MHILVALLYFDTTLPSEVQFLDIVFLHGIGGPGNTCYGVSHFQVSHFTSECSVKVKQRYHSDILGNDYRDNPYTFEKILIFILSIITLLKVYEQVPETYAATSFYN